MANSIELTLIQRKHVSKRLKKIRSTELLTQAELAEVMGTTGQTVRNAENLRGQISPTILRALREVEARLKTGQQLRMPRVPR